MCGLRLLRIFGCWQTAGADRLRLRFANRFEYPPAIHWRVLVRRAEQQLLRDSDILHQNAAIEDKSVTNRPAKCSCTLYLGTEEWVSG